MASALGGPQKQRAEMNVTPLIDVLLVLLIIFMLIQPTRSRGLKSLASDDDAGQPQSRPSDDIVISVSRDQKLRVNEQEIALVHLDERLKTLLKSSADPVIFVKGDKDIDFGDVAQVIDIAKGAGVNRVALITH